MTVPKVVIDTDAGIDDALAIFMTLAAHKRGDLQVVAITTVNGNTTVSNVCTNVLRILDTVGLLEAIPVYCGACRQLVQPMTYSEEPFHGNDGFGDASLPSPPPPASLLKEQHAVWTLLQLSKTYRDELVLAAFGPLTNIAMAMRLDPKFTSRLAGFYAMGGNTTGLGNCTTSAEFNFLCDPEAAKVVLEETERVIRLVPWETCLFDINLTYEFRKELGNIDTPSARLMNKIEHKVLAKKAFDYWITCDQLAAAWMIDDIRNRRCSPTEKNNLEVVTTSLSEGTKEYFATVELNGSYTRGQLVIDHNGQLKRNKNVKVLTKVNVDLYQRYLRMAFGGEAEMAD